MGSQNDKQAIWHVYAVINSLNSTKTVQDGLCPLPSLFVVESHTTQHNTTILVNSVNRVWWGTCVCVCVVVATTILNLHTKASSNKRVLSLVNL